MVNRQLGFSSKEKIVWRIASRCVWSSIVSVDEFKQVFQPSPLLLWGKGSQLVGKSTIIKMLTLAISFRVVQSGSAL